MLLVGAFAFLTLSLSSCSKQDFDGVTAKSNENAQQQVLRKVKNLKYNFRTANGKTTITSNGSGGVSFSSGGNTSNFSTGAGATNFANDQGSSSFANGDNGTTYNSGAGANNSFDLNGTLSAGGGTMTVDGKSISLDYIFCADGAAIFDDISDFDGEVFNVVIGISGDFEDPENAKLNYMVFMVTVGDGSSGTYKLDMDVIEEEEPTGKFGIIEVIDFSELSGDGTLEGIDDAALYISTKGNLNLSSGTYSFNGVDFSEILFDEQGDFNFGKKVKGSGNLLCQ